MRLLTTAPNRWQRAVRAACRWTPRLLVALALILLAVLVLTLRSARVVITLAAIAAAKAEQAAAVRTGRPPLGQTVGVAMFTAFLAEFTRPTQTTA